MRDRYTSLFAAPGAAPVELGALHLPTGRLYCCDPFLSDEVAPLTRQVPPGTYPVRLAAPAFHGWGRRVAAAVLVLSDAPPVAWEDAVHGAGGTSEFRVDAGLACFMDAATRDEFEREIAAFYERAPDDNYYDTVLAPLFALSADPERPTHAGDWTLYQPPAATGNVAMFASGVGDGVYLAHWGLDERGAPAVLMVDFEVEDLEL